MRDGAPSLRASLGALHQNLGYAEITASGTHNDSLEWCISDRSPHL